jgi:uncharacterized protein (DUF1810 family)
MFAHFLAAQAPIYATALAELRAGAKRSHWMWFIFPQLRALGRSATAHRYGLEGLAAARAYLADPVLGARLKQCVAAVLAVEGRSAHRIFGTPDDLKFRSSLTLFEAAADDADKTLFAAALERFYGGVRDPLTVEVVGG